MKDQVGSVRRKIKAQFGWQGQYAERRSAFKWVKVVGESSDNFILNCLNTRNRNTA